jgi:lysyl-tRNA synthetase class 2
MTRFSAPKPAAASRAFLYQTIRDFFARRQVLEVETPVLSAAGNTDPAIESFSTADDRPRWLRTSPEFFHKRLLAEYGFDLFEIGKVFRQDESGQRHNPEFSLLEWYRIGFDMAALMQEVAQLLLAAHDAFERPLDAPQFHRYRDIVQQHTGLDPFTASLTSLQKACQKGGYAGSPLARDACLDLLFATQVEPKLTRNCPVFISHYPASQAALAQIDPVDPRQALRFECFLNGLELANGYQELTDAAEQVRRFEHEQQARALSGQRSVPVDTRFLAALEKGLPACSGVALGLDRLLMIITDAQSISDVLWFPWPEC